MSRFIRLVSAFVSLSLSLSLFAAPPAPPPQNVIVDVDMDFDDILALAFLGNDPGVKINLVTIDSVGWVHCAPGLVNVAEEFRQLNLGEPRTECGRPHTLPGGHSDRVPLDWRENADNFFGLKSSYSAHALNATLSGRAGKPLPLFQQPLLGQVESRAIEAMIEVLKSANTPVTIISLSTLTNISDLFDALVNQRELADKIGGIYMMGGAFLPHKGNVEPYISGNEWAEWNMYIDPEAAQNVLKNPLGINLVQVPLNITDAVPITRHFTEGLKQLEKKTPAVQLAVRLFDKNPWLAAEKGLYFWDSLTAMLALQPGQAEYWRNQAVTVETGDNNNAGRLTRNAGGTVTIGHTLNIPEGYKDFDDWLISLLNRGATGEARVLNY
ncbi:MAG: nucleoside hydrolase [Endozoicomonas sp.]